MTVINISEEPHRIQSIGHGVLDEYVCSCGWKSHGYYDGAEYAIADWRVHVENVTGTKPKWPYQNKDNT